MRHVRRFAFLPVALAVLACTGTELPLTGYRGVLRTTPGPDGAQPEGLPIPEQGPAPAPEPLYPTHPQDGNILLLVLDDVGVDKVAAYHVGDGAPPTPNLSALAAEGRVFRHAWANPMCSPTRSAMMTGRHGRRTGVGYIIDHWKDEPELGESEITIPEMLERSKKEWTTSFVGKWHLSSLRGQGVPRAPGRQGFDWYRFLPGNLREGSGGDDTLGYAHWKEFDNGEARDETGYVTRHQADDTVARMKAMPEPWFLWTAFTATHVPLTPPPREYGNLGVSDDSSPADLYDATLRALDQELGRVLDGMGAELRARTTIIVIGDNGTPDHAVRAPFDPREAKGNVMELGVRVPLIVTGPLVKEPGPTDALVHAVDVFATVADLAGVDVHSLGAPVDGVSFYPSLVDPKAARRTTVYTEKFVPNGSGPHREDLRAIRDDRWKLVVTVENGVATEKFFDLQDREVEGPNLLRDGSLGPAQEAHRARLRAEHDRLLAELTP